MLVIGREGCVWACGRASAHDLRYWADRHDSGLMMAIMMMMRLVLLVKTRAGPAYPWTNSPAATTKADGPVGRCSSCSATVSENAQS